MLVEKIKSILGLTYKDYILVKDNNFDSAIKILSENNYEIK